MYEKKTIIFDGFIAVDGKNTDIFIGNAHGHNNPCVHISFREEYDFVELLDF